MPEDKNKETSGGRKLTAELFFWGQALVLSLVVLVTVNIFFFRISGVQGESMYPTLYNKDRVIARVVGYNDPERGDIIVVSVPEYEDDPLVKRIIAVGGDEIDIDRLTGVVYVNGEPLDEPYINETIRNFGNITYPQVVKEGYVFFMGDNRNKSTDSRWSYVGEQPVSNIIGKVIFRVFPLSRVGKVS